MQTPLGATRGGLAAQVADALNLEVGLTRVFGSTLFSSSPQQDVTSDWDWELVEDPFAADTGLRLVRDLPLLLDLPVQGSPDGG